MKTLYLLATLLVTNSAHAYYGPYSAEALLTFSASADIPGDPSTTLAELNRPGPVHDKAYKYVDDQVLHLVGSFQAKSFEKSFGYLGSLGESYQMHFTHIEPGTTESRIKVGYEFKGKVVFDKAAFRHSKTGQITVPIILPLSPDLIYKQSLTRTRNHCTDPTYNDETDFWYFWDPDQKGCPLAGDETLVLRNQGEMEELPNTKISYPEYDHIFGDNGNGSNLDIHLFYGFISDIQNYDHPRTRDDAIRNMKAFEAYLEKSGFDLTFEKKDFREYKDGSTSRGINTLHRYEKKESHTPFGEITYRFQILLADTDSKSKDETFHQYYRQSLKTADILVYDGHAGSGDNLDIESPKSPLYGTKLDPSKYQIFFFNGCSTYPWFKGMYFRAKGGSKNLEVVTSGLPTYTDTSVRNMEAFLNPFLEMRLVSYQRLLQELERTNTSHGHEPYLYGVSGEEDNQWHP